MFDRRQLISALPVLAASPAFSAADRFADLRRAITLIERDAGGPIGIALHDTGSGARFAHRANTRFPMCSTFKLLLAARLLHGADRGEWRMTDQLPVRAQDMLNPAPFTRPRIGSDASLQELAQAMVTLSDNPAANIALARIGGPAALTAWLRRGGDTITRLDRSEPEMNNETPGDSRDTTTPAAMLATCQRLLTDRWLSPQSRAQLLAWMAASQTADTMIRAALPPGWVEANKTGAGSWRARNIISIITPPPNALGARPIWLTAYLFAAKSELEERNRHFVPLGRAIVAALE